MADRWSIAMAGCGIKHGLTVGATNDKGTFVATEEYDIGHMFHTWFRALEIDPVKTEYDNGGQPLPIAHDDMKAIDENGVTRLVAYVEAEGADEPGRGEQLRAELSESRIHIREPEARFQRRAVHAGRFTSA